MAKKNKKVISKAKSKIKPKSKPQPKKKSAPAKKSAKKIVQKKPAAKKAPAKKSAAKKIIKKLIKNITPKKLVKKPAAKKAVVKKPAAKQASKPVAKAALKSNIKALPKKEANKKVEPKKLVAVKETKVIKAAPSQNEKRSEGKVAEFKSKKTDYLKHTMKPQVKKTPLTKKIELPANYKPTEKEEYMSANQLEYFRRKLEDWKRELLQESTETIQHLQAESWNEPDPSDQATIVEQTGLELRTRDRYRKLIAKIDAAMGRIETGDYGYCEVTGEPIGLARLQARPIATMTIAAQEQHELEEKLTMEG